MRLRTAVLLLLVVVASAPRADAATLRVCSSGCPFQGLQAAIDAAAAGDTILLAAGQTFVGPFVLRAKPAVSGSLWITIRSDAPDSALPADGVRLVPMGAPRGNTRREVLARLVGRGGTLVTTPVITTEPGAHHYALRFLEIDGSANLGYETLIAFGENSTAAPPFDLIVDRCYIHGHRWKGQKRGIALNSTRTDILNSYITDIKAIGYDSQAIAGFNGAGPFRIVNNYLEGAGENVMFGGADPAILNLVPADIEIARNHISKPLAWRNSILSAPSGVSVTGASGGVLPGGTHYFSVVAVMDAGDQVAVSPPSPAAALSSGSSAAFVSWQPVPGADRYRIYRGSLGGESRFIETSSAASSFTYSAGGEQHGAPAPATFWTVKNLFELKNAERVRLEGNLIENIWTAGQSGYALVLTPRNQDGRAPWSRVRDVVILNNVVRHAPGVLQVAGFDSPNISQQTLRITVRNNLFEDIGPAWGTGGKVFLLGDGVAGVTIDHNTILHGDTTVVHAYGSQPILGFVYTNNIAVHGDYGIMGDNARPGQYTLDLFFPGATVRGNVLAGGSAAAYPAGNAFPTAAQWVASFVDPFGGDYRRLSSSVFAAAGIGGVLPGAEFRNLAAAMGGSAGGFTWVLPPLPPSGFKVSKR